METIEAPAAADSAKNDAVKDQNEVVSSSVSVPPTPDSVEVSVPLTVEDNIKSSTSCDSKNDDNVSLVVHVDDPNDLDYDLFGGKPKPDESADGEAAKEEPAAEKAEEASKPAETTTPSAEGAKDAKESAKTEEKVEEKKPEEKKSTEEKETKKEEENDAKSKRFVLILLFKL
jgi:flagellar biosynthesis GTPase FlhF